MTKTQLHKEYSKTMQEAEHTSGRRETLNLYKKARLIKKELQYASDNFKADREIVHTAVMNDGDALVLPLMN